jgi:hypothetical protein
MQGSWGSVAVVEYMNRALVGEPIAHWEGGPLLLFYWKCFSLSPGLAKHAIHCCTVLSICQTT